MQTEDKYCNIYDLDLSASTDTFIRKLADINIFITEKDIENYKAAFFEHDEDGSGNISTEELGAVMKKLGENPTEEHLLGLVNKFDEDGNGTIEFSEFLVMMTTKAKEAEIEESENFIPCCFRAMRDRHGRTLKESSMSVDHLRFVMQSLPREVHMTRKEMNKVVDEIATTFGVEKDGFFTYDQFIQMMNR